MWTRFLTYMVISSFFVNWKFIINNIFTKYSIFLIIVTLFHVYTSYRGFQLLDSGIAYVIFYTYPLMILIMSGHKISALMLLTIVGIYILSQQNTEKNHRYFPEFTKENMSNKSEEYFKYEGVFMMILAAFSEAIIYFIIRNIKTDNNWNHLFISYSFGALILSIYYLKNIKNIESFTENNRNDMKENAKIFLYDYLDIFLDFMLYLD